ncbi:MAG TPA: hypothetical protein VH061_05335 [Solirubrobacteraceae bacterium]|jgi:hypothetical protein|nr:hypothetical protein [Solirubrobacteraceae bacterium]
MRRHFDPLRPTLGASAVLLAGLLTLGLAAGASAAEPLPTFEKPAEQVGTTGVPVTTVLVKGTSLATVIAKALPDGLALTASATNPETELEITGTPTTASASTVTLEASNKENSPAVSTTFEWTVAQGSPTLDNPGVQNSTAGVAITTIHVKGTGLESLGAKELPGGLELTKVSEAEWTIGGIPMAPKAATTVTLEASNKAEGTKQTTSFQWMVAEETTPAAPPATSTPTPESPAPIIIPPIDKVTSAGRLGTVPTQNPGKSLTASFLCEVAACRVVITATVTAGKSKFKIRSSPTSIKTGQKAKIALKLTKKQQTLIAAALKKHKKVSATVAASIESTVGLQTTKSLAIAVRR